jgi:hypothetical protein|tara:strand:- start:196 stop:459 length:264 start_codon:yes stop_codon:yes gene_type:complete
MALKKQSIRSKHHITVEGKTVSKDILITRSEDWNETQENFFRKMLKQGGTFKVAGVKYKIEIEERNDLDSNRQAPVNLPPIPGERSF